MARQPRVGIFREERDTRPLQRWACRALPARRRTHWCSARATGRRRRDALSELAPRVPALIPGIESPEALVSVEEDTVAFLVRQQIGEAAVVEQVCGAGGELRRRYADAARAPAADNASCRPGCSQARRGSNVRQIRRAIGGLVEANSRSAPGRLSRSLCSMRCKYAAAVPAVAQVLRMRSSGSCRRQRHSAASFRRSLATFLRVMMFTTPATASEP